MNDRQDAVVDMYQEEDRLFLREAQKVAKDVILKTHTDIFHVDVLELARYMQAQEFDSKGFASKKKLAKTKLSELIFKLTASLCSFAIDTNNQPIEEEFDVSVSYVNKKNDADFVNYSNRLITSLGEYIKDLKPYHISADDVSRLSNKTVAYSDLLHIPDEVIKDKAIATEKIKELITKCHKMLEDSIDRDMIYYQEKDEPFYLEYQKRREIHDANTHALSIKGTVVDADGKKPLQHVKVIAKFKAGSELADKVKSTSHIGNFQFKSIPEGKCKLTFEKNYYNTITVDSEVNSGEYTRIDVEMRKTIK